MAFGIHNPTRNPYPVIDPMRYSFVPCSTSPCPLRSSLDSAVLRLTDSLTDARFPKRRQSDKPRRKRARLRPPGPYAWVKYVPGGPILPNQPNEGSLERIKQHRSFILLLDLCLKSPLLPAFLAAAFCNSGALVIIALVHNLLQRHPSINCLVHQEGGRETTDNASGEEKHNVDGQENAYDKSGLSDRRPGIDHFNDEESDPNVINAISSFCPLRTIMLSEQKLLKLQSKISVLVHMQQFLIVR